MTGCFAEQCKRPSLYHPLAGVVTLQDIHAPLGRLAEYNQIRQGLADGVSPILATGLSPIHRAQFIHALCRDTGTGALVLAKDDAAAARIHEELGAFFGEDAVLLYPSRSFMFRAMQGESLEYEHARLRVLGQIFDAKAPLVVASAAGALQYTMPGEILRQNRVRLAPGQPLSVDGFTRLLLGAGYERVEQIEGVCQFAVRGGILDFYSPDAAAPVRVELWGNEIDTIATFAVDTQRREENLEEAVISPAREMLYPTAAWMADQLTRYQENLRGKYAPAAKAHIEEDIRLLQAGLALSSGDRYIPLFYERPATLFDYMPHAPLLLCDFAGIKETLRHEQWQLGEDMAALLEEGLLSPGCQTVTKDYTDLMAIVSDPRSKAVVLDSFVRNYSDLPARRIVSVRANPLPVWSGQMNTLVEDLQDYLERDYFCIVFAGLPKAAVQLARDLAGAGLPVAEGANPGAYQPRKVVVCPGHLPGGFDYPDIKWVGFSWGKGAGSTKKRGRKGPKAGDKLKSLSDLSPGDYVVHVSHGIGIFEGIIKKEVEGVIKDYIQIRYGGTDMLFVPVTQLDLVTKYISGRGEGGNIKLSRLHSGEWQKTRKRVKAAASDMAKELIALYSARMKVQGHAFSPDNDWQNDFEQRFIYEETDDQLRCIVEIKEDMQAQAPMDRLLCGDVGFGKTEVALRAAFKCMLDSKQCAILVPTTILAWQHYQTILSRMEGFPVTVELLSRFRTAAQQRKTIERLRTGEVDIVVGTHRLLQKDIQFKDLGLCIIDEEQRFGVAHKEKMKQLRNQVDVLTLSATPIPRTLNMAMSGIRDMSIIEEAPQDRHPVQTYVLEYDQGLVAEAIRKELRRGGQVFYLHNRVDSIESCAARLQKLLPDAKIATGHGKMGEEDLSEVWRRLVERDIDILVCTTIIETGVDVPNCNTLIIEDADRMGLSQLYQLRGRVGRSDRRAFAYFTFNRGKLISEVAEKRLSAIREFTSFGSGFRIAMRDLEIRGAGDILGSQQHGNMEAVGYDLYLRLLSEAISEEKGEPVQQAAECMVDIRTPAHIPEAYIGDLGQRIDIYKKIAAIRGDEDAMDLIDELIDRFGDPPAAVKGLVDVALLRGKASMGGIREISQKGDSILLFPETLDLARAGSLAQGLRGRVLVSAGAKPYITVRMAPGQKPVDCIRETLPFLQDNGQSGLQ